MQAGGELGHARIHDQEQLRVLRVARTSLPRRQHRFGRAEQRCRQEVRLGGLVPRLQRVSRAGVVQQLHRLPVARDGDSLWLDEEGERGQEVRPHAELDAVCVDAHAVLYSGELPDA